MKLSLITATYDRPHTLTQKALPSVLAQQTNATQLEWIVVNDGIDSETTQLVQSLHADFPVIHLPMQHPKDGFGLCHARNYGLSAATGDIVAYLDDDNEIAPAFTAKTLRFFENYPDIRFSMVQQHRRRDAPQKHGKSFIAPSTDCTVPALIRQDELFDSNGFAHRRENAPQWNPAFRIFCDYRYFLDCIEQWGDVAFALQPTILVDYRQTTDGIIGQSHYGEWAEELHQICRAAEADSVLQPYLKHLENLADHWQAQASQPIAAFKVA